MFFSFRLAMRFSIFVLQGSASHYHFLRRFAHQCQCFQKLLQNFIFSACVIKNLFFFLWKAEVHWPALVGHGNFSVPLQGCWGLPPLSFWLCGSWTVVVSWCVQIVPGLKRGLALFRLYCTKDKLSFTNRNTVFWQGIQSTMRCQVSGMFIEPLILVTTDSP